MKSEWTKKIKSFFRYGLQSGNEKKAAKTVALFGDKKMERGARIIPMFPYSNQSKQ
jgi:hypothetical protein